MEFHLFLWLAALPWGSGAALAPPLAYLADVNDPGVTVVDLATKQVRGVIALPAIPFGLTVSPSQLERFREEL